MRSEIMSHIRHILILLLTSTLLFALSAWILAQETVESASIFVPRFNIKIAETGTLLMEKVDEREMWWIDTNSGKASFFYELPPEINIHNTYFDRKKRLFYAVIGPTVNEVSRFSPGVYELVEIDVNTGQQTTIYHEDNLTLKYPHPFQPDHFVISHFPGTLYPGLPNSPVRYYQQCLLNIATRVCTEYTDYAARLLADVRDEPLWLSETTFLAIDVELVQVNVETGEKEQILPGWQVFDFAPLHTENALLLVAQPEPDRPSITKRAGIYRLDLETFTLSEKLFDTPEFDDHIGGLTISPNDNYFYYNWLRRPQQGSTILIDLVNRQQIKEFDRIGFMTWLPNGERLVGVARGPNLEYEAVVKVDAATGEIETLFEIDNRVRLMLAE